MPAMIQSREYLLKGKAHMINLLVLTRSEQLVLAQKIYFIFYKTSYLSEELNRTEPSLSKGSLYKVSCSILE